MRFRTFFSDVKSICFAGLVALALMPAVAAAQSVGVDVSTQGLGVEVGADFSQYFGLRIDGNYFRVSHGFHSDNVDYHGRARLMSFGLVGDLYPIDSGFRLTGGGYLNRNHADIQATPTSSVTIGSTVYAPSDIGTLSGTVRYPDFAPYAGVGYTSNRGGSGFSFVVDAGVMFQGGSLVTLTSNGGALSADPTLQTDLENERAEIKRDVDKLRFFPVLKLGAAYRF